MRRCELNDKVLETAFSGQLSLSTVRL